MSLEELLSQVRTFREMVVDPNVARWEHDRTMAVDALRDAATLGLMGMEVPVEQGGLGIGFLGKLAVADLLCETSMPFAFSLINTANVAARMATAGTDSQRERYLDDLLTGRRFGCSALTELGAGSDFAAIRTRAERVDGGWKLNGEKAWITNAAEADIVLCYAQTEPGSGGSGIGSFLVDGRHDGFVRNEPYDLMGGHLIGTGGFQLVDHFVADEDVLAPPGQGFKAALESINGARTYVASMCCAMVRTSLGHAVAYGTHRQAFGKTLLDHQGLAWSLADVANQLEAAQLLTQVAARSIAAGDNRAAMTQAAHAKKFATEMAEPAIAACIQAMGANGLREEMPMGRHMAAARIANYTDGSTQIMTDRIAATLAETYPLPPEHPAW
ncbi:MAG: acyl-CoA dehydrogenase [Actinomycetia bacterium]|nr:acyl-CoA dehydrogenase [Actinomycetes bacterium]MCP4085328.1 acyl-CoA dehydrogenase [Actinomycetes bacterium]